MSAELRIAVLEDDPTELGRIRDALEKQGEYGAEYFSDPSAMLEAARKEPAFDLAFLDIFLVGANGVEVARKLRDMTPETDLAFITTSREFAVEAYDLGALHYLVKPVTVEDVAEALRRKSPPSVVRPSITLKVNRESNRVYLDSIVSIQSARHLIEVKLKDGRCLRVWQPLSEIEAMLNGDFLKINRGVIINLNEVTRMDPETCTLSDGSLLPVKQRDRAAIRKRYDDFLINELHLMAASKRRDGK